MATDYKKEHYVTINPCTKCQPLGSIFSFKGVQNCLPFIHGSQGCATYMRLHIAHHFREPIDVASSSLSERSAVYGGKENLFAGLKNAMKVYQPDLIGVASSCLAETIGEDLAGYSHTAKNEGSLNTVFVSTPSYKECHIYGFNRTNLEILKHFFSSQTEEAKDAEDLLCEANAEARSASLSDNAYSHTIGLILGTIISPRDIRFLKDIGDQLIVEAFKSAKNRNNGFRKVARNIALADKNSTSDAKPYSFVIFPDYADNLNGPFAESITEDSLPGSTTNDEAEYGTDPADIVGLKNTLSNIILGDQFAVQGEVADLINREAKTTSKRVSLPVGLRLTDVFFKTLTELTNKDVPKKFLDQRGRLLDAMIDAHKQMHGLKVVIYGDPDMAFGLTSLCLELGMQPVTVATGSKTESFIDNIEGLCEDIAGRSAAYEKPVILKDASFQEIGHHIKQQHVDLILANSHASYISEHENIPLIRVGFPTYDMFGGEHILTLGYEGMLELIIKIVSAVDSGHKKT